MTKTSAMMKFLEGLYIPAGKRIEYNQCIREISRHCLRDIEPLLDKSKTGIPMLFIKTKGKGIRATFQGYCFAKVDFNHIGKKYAEAYIRESDTASGIPVRLMICSPRYAVIQ